MKKQNWYVIIPILIVGAAAAGWWFYQHKANQSDTAKIAYSIGRQIGQNLKNQGLKLDPEMIEQGIRDVVNNKASLFSDEQMQAAVHTMQAEEQKKLEAEAKENLRKGEEFLKANAEKSYIKTDPSGLQYQVLKEGSGKAPKKDSLRLRSGRSCFAINYFFTLTSSISKTSTESPGIPGRGVGP